MVAFVPTMKPEGVKKEEKAAPAPAQAPAEKIDFSKVEIEPCLPTLWTLIPLPSPISGP